MGSTYRSTSADMLAEVVYTSAVSDVSYPSVEASDVVLAYNAKNRILFDTTKLLETFAHNTAKALVDSSAISDQPMLTLSKSIQNNITFTDSMVGRFGKSIFEDAFIGDKVNYTSTVSHQGIVDTSDLLNIHPLKAVYNTVGISDEFTRIAVFNKHLHDTVAIDDVFSVAGALNFSKFNVASAVDNTYNHSNKVLIDSCFTTDSSAIMPQKVTLDTISMQDIYILNNVKSITDNAFVIDVIDIITVSVASSKFNASAFNTSTFG